MPPMKLFKMHQNKQIDLPPDVFDVVDKVNKNLIHSKIYLV